MLGLHPGLGGTARFTQLVNPMQAMTLMLTGKTIDARRAKSLGLVDAVTQERHVRNAVKDAVFGRLKRARPGLLNTVLESRPVARLARLAHAPRGREGRAAGALSRALRADRSLGKARRRQAPRCWRPRRLVRRLMVTPTAQNLIRVFFLREQMKKLAGSGNKIEHVHVIGAGAMGGDIAAWCAGAGHARHARRHEGGADRGRDQARRRSVRQDHAQAHRRARRARPADPGHGRRGRPQRRPHHRGGAGKARAEAEGLCRRSSRR